MPTAVQYVVNLSSHAEAIQCTGPGIYSDERRCTLFRSGRRITDFIAGRSQLSKIKKRRGKISITQRAISRAQGSR